ncbi:MAG: FAD-dependent oxidoreductase, partial [Mycobacterium kyogaense]|uniref:protoporphyrinogen/coproporphyrinogen oxidase n=1 Tax=Mycobacterium kyogaense TaxID=2212479 RepID=UPI002FF7DA0E
DRGEDMETWARRRLGDTLFECFVRPLIEPSFGTDCRDLSVPYLQGIMKRAHRAKFFLPRDGMGELCVALTRDVKVELQTEVEAVDARTDKVEVRTSDGEVLTAEGIVVATDSVSAATILAPNLDEQSVKALRSAPYASMAHVNLRWAEDPLPDNEFEMLLPVGTGPRPLLGTIMKTSRTSRLVPAGARMTDSYFSSEATRTLSDDELINVALQHVSDIYGCDLPDTVAEVFSIDRALAVSPPGSLPRDEEGARLASPQNRDRRGLSGPPRSGNRRRQRRTRCAASAGVATRSPMSAATAPACGSPNW